MTEFLWQLFSWFTGENGSAPRKAKVDKISKDAIAQYLTAEMQSITQRAIQYETMLLNKVNFYLAIVTATIGGLILSAGISEIKEFLLPLACAVLLVLAIIGWVTLVQGLDLSANSTFMYRRMGRIRQWFLDQEPGLFLYLPFSPGDNRPSFHVQYARMRSMESILLIVNAVVASMFFVLLWFFLCFQEIHWFAASSNLPYLIGFGLGTVLFSGFWIIEFKYTQNYMQSRDRKERRKKDVHFPAEEIRARFGSLLEE